MPVILEGKVALVTGVSHDGQVGQTVAKVLAENGAALAICARTQSNVEKRAEELRQAGARVLAVAASLADETQVRQLIERVLSEYKKIDILINVAGGLTRYKSAVEHSLDDWNHELNNNLLSAFLASRAVFPHMQNAGGGAIVNFARAGLPQANMLAYNCAKAGIEALTRTLALEGRDTGIRVKRRGTRACGYGIEYCRDETQRSEALDQALGHRRDRGFSRLRSRRRDHGSSDCGNWLGIVAWMIWKGLLEAGPSQKSYPRSVLKKPKLRQRLKP